MKKIKEFIEYMYIDYKELYEGQLKRNNILAEDNRRMYAINRKYEDEKKAIEDEYKAKIKKLNKRIRTLGKELKKNG